MSQGTKVELNLTFGHRLGIFLRCIFCQSIPVNSYAVLPRLPLTSARIEEGTRNKGILPSSAGDEWGRVQTIASDNSVRRSVLLNGSRWRLSIPFCLLHLTMKLSGRDSSQMGAMQAPGLLKQRTLPKVTRQRHRIRLFIDL